MRIPIETLTLGNGLRVVLSEDHTAPIVAVNLWYHVGSGNERQGRTGFAHLFEHMLFQGSEHVAANEHFELIARAGGTLNGSTWLDRTNYYETVPSNQLALALWLANRALDGLDGALARATTATDRGGFLDIVADFTVYGGFVLAVAIAEPDARLACAALLVTYYVSGTAFLAWSSLAERRALETGDERSLRFVAGLAEGTETVIAYILFCLFPGRAEEIAWGFAAIVAITALQRTVFAARALRAEPRPPPGGAPR